MHILKLFLPTIKTLLTSNFRPIPKVSDPTAAFLSSGNFSVPTSGGPVSGFTPSTSAVTSCSQLVNIPYSSSSPVSSQLFAPASQAAGQPSAASKLCQPAQRAKAHPAHQASKLVLNSVGSSTISSSSSTGSSYSSSSSCSSSTDEFASQLPRQTIAVPTILCPDVKRSRNGRTRPPKSAPQAGRSVSESSSQSWMHHHQANQVFHSLSTIL